MNERRNSIGIFYEILVLCGSGITKTQAVTRTNLNFRLMDKYIDFLTGHGYVLRDSAFAPQELMLTIKGRHFLALLSELKREIPTFGAFQHTPVGPLSVYSSE